jgi:hypothetical protein
VETRSFSEGREEADRVSSQLVDLPRTPRSGDVTFFGTITYQVPARRFYVSVRENDGEESVLHRTLVFRAAETESLEGWPAPSRRRTTDVTALRLEAATRPDATPRLPEVEIDDGFGI